VILSAAWAAVSKKKRMSKAPRNFFIRPPPFLNAD
jgi:hypothetical protein